MIPPDIEVIGKDYSITLVQRETGDYGECFHDDCRIEVASYQCEQQRRDTLLHELFHAVDHEMHCSMTEPQVRRMSTGLLAVLRRNPALVAYLTEA